LEYPAATSLLPSARVSKFFVVNYVTPDFRRETRCITYVCQDLVPHIC
jgi:hypothetical protein